MVFWVTCSRGLDAFSGLEIWARYFRNDEMELVEIERTVCVTPFLLEVISSFILLFHY